MASRERVIRALNHEPVDRVHNIMGDVPPENIVAMLDTAYEESF